MYLWMQWELVFVEMIGFFSQDKAAIHKASVTKKYFSD